MCESISQPNEQKQPTTTGTNTNQVLLEKGASTKATVNGGFAPLHIAAQKGHWPVARELIAAGSPLSPRHNEGGCPLGLAAQFGHAEVGVGLLKAGADPGSKDDGLVTPLHSAVKVK